MKAIIKQFNKWAVMKETDPKSYTRLVWVAFLDGIFLGILLSAVALLICASYFNP